MTEDKISHWKKKGQADNKREILRLLRDNNELRNIDLKKKLAEKGIQVSDPTLSAYIKSLEEAGKIEHFSKTGSERDRREKWYRIRTESIETVKGELYKYEAIKFIESIPDPIYAYQVSPDGRKAFAVFASLPDANVPNNVRIKMRQTLETFAKGLFSFYIRTLMNVLKIKGQKVALVIMAEGA